MSKTLTPKQPLDLKKGRKEFLAVANPTFVQILGNGIKDSNNFTFQQEAVYELFELTNVAIQKQRKNLYERTVLLEAPTGSGKTVMAGGYISELFKQFDNCLVLWISETPNLTKQSLKTLERLFQLPTTFYDGSTLNEYENKAVIGINWEAIKGKKSRTDGESHKSIETVMNRGDNDDLVIVTIIDEAHSHTDTKQSKDFLEIINSDFIIEITATPLKGYKNRIKVHIEDVQEAGFIKKGISINDNLPTYNEEYRSKEDVHSITEFFLNESLKKRKDLEKQIFEYAKINDGKKPFVPLLVIQLPNNSDELTKDVEAFYERKGYSRENGKLSIYTSDDYTDELDEICKNENIQILLFKQAISKGWDCPRASLITLLREPQREHFAIQTIGRTMRMPYREPYPASFDDLNYSYAYIEETNNAIIQRIKQSIQQENHFVVSERKSDFKTAIDYLKKETVERKKETTFILEELDSFINLLKVTPETLQMLHESERDNTISFFEGSASYKDLKEEKIEGSKRDNSHTLSIIDIKKKFENILLRSKISFEIADKMIDKIIKTNKETLQSDNLKKKSQLQSLFVQSEKAEQLFISLYTQTLNKFVEAREDELRNKKITKDWGIPLRRTYSKQHKEMTSWSTEKYPYPEIYLSEKNALEEEFSQFLNENDKVIAWYKNGDNGTEHFSIAYDYKGDNLLFYPDFLIETEDRLYIVETKGKIDDEKNKEKNEALYKYSLKSDLPSLVEKELVVGFIKKENDLFQIYQGKQLNSEATNWKPFILK